MSSSIVQAPMKDLVVVDDKYNAIIDGSGSSTRLVNDGDASLNNCWILALGSRSTQKAKPPKSVVEIEARYPIFILQ